MRQTRWLTTILMLVLTGCGGGESATDAPASPQKVDPGEHNRNPAQAPPPPIDVTGTWHTTGTWDLGGPFAAGDTMGDLAAEIIVEEIMGAVPETLQDAIREKVESHIGDKIRDYVDGHADPALQPGGVVYEALATVFATVEVDTRLELSPHPDEEGVVVGTETVTAMRLPLLDGLSSVPATLQYRDEDIAISVAADVWATRTGDTLSIAERGFDIRLDALAGWALRVILETTGGPSSADLESALFCAALVEEITGGETIEIPVLWTSVDIDASLLTKACDKAETKLGESLFGKLRFDTGVLLGGDVQASDTDSDGVADRLVSTDSYVGEFTKLPTPIDPVVIATFEAGR